MNCKKIRIYRENIKIKFCEYIIEFIENFYKFININLKFIIVICEIDIIKFFKYKIKYIEIMRFIFNKYILNDFNIDFNTNFFYNVILL